ncbi:MAG: hypothetical protein HRT44_03815 [Bdellovibrionales bacterium]|nr:hypothetical protein [Bdellovibrionales bacterium]NQZ18370.1 hypothetical protein [Bdellovibrionales bacterium]
MTVTRARRPNCRNVNITNANMTVAESSRTAGGPTLRSPHEVRHRGIVSSIFRSVQAICGQRRNGGTAYRFVGDRAGCTGHPRARLSCT